jgi:hypothetical protein
MSRRLIEIISGALTKSHRSVAATIFLGLSLLAARTSLAAQLIPSGELNRLGLSRAWFAQVQLDRARDHVERAVLKGDRLTVLTSAGLVHEFNALTGETAWIAPIGNSNYPSLGPAASDQFVALLNGSTLYVLDRVDGRPVFIRRVSGAPGAAPALSKDYVFVPLVNGRMEAYPLGRQVFTPWYYQSFGRAMVAPLTTPESIVWSTDSGRLYVGNCNALGLRFRLETGSQIVAPPGYKTPFVYVASMAGEVFAMHETSGMQQWKFPTGFPVTRSPAAIGEEVFVTSDEPALHCVEAKDGHERWEVPHVTQFAARSKDRVYVVDDLRSLIVLDAKSGARVGQIATNQSIVSLVNDQTDRVYLVSTAGIVECLHEIEAKEPLRHNPPPQPEAEKPVKPAAGKPAPKLEPTAPTGEAAAATGAEKPPAAVPPQPAPPGAGKAEEDDPFKNLQ